MKLPRFVRQVISLGLDMVDIVVLEMRARLDTEELDRPIPDYDPLDPANDEEPATGLLDPVTPEALSLVANPEPPPSPPDEDEPLAGSVAWRLKHGRTR